MNDESVLADLKEYNADRAPVHRNGLSRVYELRDLLPDPVPAGAYFENFDTTLTEWPGKKEGFLEIEADLQGLDAEAWAFLKKELAPLLRAKHLERGWQQLFDKLNQAKGYNHLTRLGCVGVRFVPEAKVKGQMTPDIEATENGRTVLCEVKTINISQNEAIRRATGAAGTSTDQLSELFLGKLRSTIDQAAEQMQAYNPDVQARRLAYLVLNFDDMLHEYADRYGPQLEEFRLSRGAFNPEVVFYYRNQPE